MTTSRNRYPPATGASDVSDAALIERSLTEPEAFTGLFDRYGAALHRYVRRRLGVDDAADVVADTFLAAFGHRHRYDPARTEAGPWLYGIASNIIGRYRRAEQRAYRAWAQSGADPVTEPFTERVDNRVTAAGAAPRLAAALAGMSPTNRDVLLLIAWANLSHEETAAALDISEGTVRSRLHRARQAIRTALGDSDPRASTEGLSHG